jgi:GTP-binding protein
MTATPLPPHSDRPDHPAAGPSVVAIVGRPNVGKSTLVNRFLGRREAVVADVEGVTRDRVAYETEWRGRPFIVLDTGGWDVRGRGLARQVTEQAELAAAAADVVVLVVDAVIGPTDADASVARALQRSGKPVVVAANKADDARTEADAASFWQLGLGAPQPVSALHGRGSGDLLDEIYRMLPAEPAPVAPPPGEERRVAIVGRPNVGKSSLLNRLVGEARVLVDEEGGTTRDPVDAVVSLAGRRWRVVDTAGLRRRVGQASGSEYYAGLRTMSALERAEVAVVVLDASEPIADQDRRIAAMVADAGRACVLAVNKWDLVDADRQVELERDLAAEMASVAWALRINVSARTGRGTARVAPALARALQAWSRRVPTGHLNAWLTDVVNATPPPGRSGRAPRVLFATQAGTAPPRFVLFTTGFLEAGYRRFLERRLRESFDFAGSPIAISVRVRDRRTAEPRR